MKNKNLKIFKDKDMKNIKSIRNNKYESILYFSICDKFSQDIAIYRLNKINELIHKRLLKKKYIDKASIKLFLINEKCSLRNTFFNFLIKNIVFKQRIKSLKFIDPLKEKNNLFFSLFKELIHFFIKPSVYFIESVTYILTALILDKKIRDIQREITTKKSILFVYPDDEINNLKYSRYKKRNLSNVIRISLGKSRFLFNHLIVISKILVKNKRNKSYKLTLIDSLFRIKDIKRFFLKVIYLYFFLGKDLISYIYKIVTIKKRKNKVKIIEKRIKLLNNIIGGSLLRRLLISESIEYLFKESNNLREVSYPKEGAFWENLVKKNINRQNFFAESFSKTKILDCRTLSPKNFNEINIDKKLFNKESSFYKKSLNYFDYQRYKNITYFLTGFSHLDKELLEDAIFLNSCYSFLKINFRSHPDTDIKIIQKIKRLDKKFLLNKSWVESDIFFGSIYSSYVYSLSKDTNMPGFIKVNLDLMNIQPYLDPILLEKYFYYENIKEII